MHLKGLTNLKELDLTETQVTDAGLVHLAGMNLTSLVIPKQARTDIGLKHYLNATKPTTGQELRNWKITDAGLVHLKGLTNLENLSLFSTQATAAGVAELKKALPKCRIAFT